jgi:hypothetical protein
MINQLLDNLDALMHLLLKTAVTTNHRQLTVAVGEIQLAQQDQDVRKTDEQYQLQLTLIADEDQWLEPNTVACSQEAFVGSDVNVGERLKAIEPLLKKAKKELSESAFRIFTEQIEQIMVRMVFNLRS